MPGLLLFVQIYSIGISSSDYYQFLMPGPNQLKEIEDIAKACPTCAAKETCPVQDVIAKGAIPDTSIPENGKCLLYFCGKVCLALRKLTLDFRDNEVSVSCEPLNEPLKNSRFWTVNTNPLSTNQVEIPTFCPLANNH